MACDTESCIHLLRDFHPMKIHFNVIRKKNFAPRKVQYVCVHVHVHVRTCTCTCTFTAAISLCPQEGIDKFWNTTRLLWQLVSSVSCNG